MKERFRQPNKKPSKIHLVQIEIPPPNVVDDWLKRNRPNGKPKKPLRIELPMHEDPQRERKKDDKPRDENPDFEVDYTL
jgi:hypothetical protein